MSINQVNPWQTFPARNWAESRNWTELHHAHTRLNLTCDVTVRTNIWDVRNVEGAGQGCIALSYIPRGTLIFKEAPLFVIEEVENGPISKNTMARIRYAVTNLNNDDTRRFKALADPSRKRTIDVGKFQINNFQMTVHPTRNTSQQGIFLNASKFNHSCVPNAYFNWNPALGCLTVFTTRGISGGEEILINYQHPNAYKSRAERRQSLQEAYYFECNCITCRDGPDLASNEELRTRMRDLDGRIQASDDSTPTRCENIRRLLGLLKAAGITYPQNAELNGQLAESWKELMDQIDPRETQYRTQCREAAADAASRKLEAEIVAVGDDAAEVQETLALIGSVRA
ncbi:MAG: hypothetical protein Q9182_007575 [Xanthomendoza sp. 2 TL-2023]